MAKKKNDRADQDSPWKRILRFYCPDAIQFFCPDIAEDIDWSQPIEFLDKELQQLTPDSEIGKRFADQLVKVYRKGGESVILLIHLEVQAEAEVDFPKRMFIYMIRIFEYFDQAPISLAILCDSDANWRPNQYSFVTSGSALQFDFTAVKLLDYRSRWDELEASENIFATVVMTHLKTQDTKRNESERKQWKLTLIKRLYERGYDRSTIMNLFAFVDWLMILSNEAKVSFWQELRTYEEERQMPYITSVEQIGYDRGKVEERISIALNMLKRNLDLQTIAEITGLTIAQIQDLQGQVS
jgi:predicted transposase/invertase (TIGR01784 family)